MSNDLQNTQTGITVEEVRVSLDSTDNGAVKNSIRNCDMYPLYWLVQ